MAKYALLRMRANSPEPEPVTEVNIIPVIDISRSEERRVGKECRL